MNEKKVNLKTASQIMGKAIVDQEFRKKLVDEKVNNDDLFKEHDIETEEHLKFVFKDLGDEFNPDKFDININFDKQSETDTVITFTIPLPTNPVAPVKILVGDDEIILTCTC